MPGESVLGKFMGAVGATLGTTRQLATDLLRQYPEERQALVTLTQRSRQLAMLAERRGIDWRSRMGNLPQTDPRVVVAALATMLGFSVAHAFDERLSIEDLEERSQRLAQLKQVEEQAPEGEGGRKAPERKREQHP